MDAVSNHLENKTPLLWDYVAQTRPDVESALALYLPAAPPHVPTRFNEAAHYALFPGGKRLRPVLTLLGAELVGGTRQEALSAAVAVEFVHTSSLIFDDLPCMDDAAERRGRRTLHKKYGEGLAVLVALSFLNTAYGLVFADVTGDTARAVAAHHELVECIGASGMVAGQSVDLAAKGHSAPESVRNLKTSALMRLALRLGAIRAGGDARQLTALARYAQLMGDAYQISDDVLDLAEDAALAQDFARALTLTHSDGAEAARQRVATLTSEAQAALLKVFGATPPALVLCALADYIAARTGSG